MSRTGCPCRWTSGAHPGQCPGPSAVGKSCRGRTVSVHKSGCLVETGIIICHQAHRFIASLTPSLPQPVKFLGERCMDMPANSIFSSPITYLPSRLCVMMKILSHASVKKKTKRLKGFRFRTFSGCFQVTSWQSRG